MVLGSAFRILLLLLVALAAAPARAAPEHAIAMLSQPKYGPDFTHFDYADPNAPKGGTLTESAIGTFDNLNPYIVKGAAAAGLGLIGNTLTVGSQDEPFTEYGCSPRPSTWPDDRSWVTFKLRPEARWQDGQPITADDVVFTFDTLKTKGRPSTAPTTRTWSEAEKLGERQGPLRLRERQQPRAAADHGPAADRCPKHYWEGREFDKTTLEPPLGSGPYRVESVEPGRSITYERVKDWWGADLPVNSGRNNFDSVRYDYYRDATVALEAFKAGQIDLRGENSSPRTGPPPTTSRRCDQGLIVKERDPDRERRPGCRASSSTSRRPVFQDRARAPGARPTRSTSSGPTRTCSTALYTADQELLRQLASSPPPACPTRRELELLEPLTRQAAARGVHQGLQAAGRPTAPATTATSCARRSTCSRRRAGRSRTASWSRRDRPAARVRDPARTSRRSSAIVAALRARTWSGSASRRRVRTVDTAQYQRRQRRLRLRHDRRRLRRVASRRATSSATSGAAEAADTPGSRNLIGHQGPGGRRADRAGDRRARPRETWWPHAARSTACCCGTTT